MIVPKGTAWRGAQRQLSAPNVSQNTYLCYTAKGGPATRLHRVQCVMDHLWIKKHMQIYTHVHVHMCDYTCIRTHTHTPLRYTPVVILTEVSPDLFYMKQKKVFFQSLHFPSRSSHHSFESIHLGKTHFSSCNPFNHVINSHSHRRYTFYLETN